jgi:KDO2-lipid IV(A) lauroyltransferase
MMNTARAQFAADQPLSTVPWGYRVQAWGAALCFAAFRALPIDVASAIGGTLARWIGPALGISKRARKNLAAALPGLSAPEIDHTIKGMWDNLGRVVAEYPHLHNIRGFVPGGRVETVGFEHVDRALAAGRGIIFFSAHLANWEIVPFTTHKYGIEAVTIYRAANNPLVDRMIVGLRSEAGEIIPKGSAGARRAIATLRRGGNLGLLADQKLNDGIPVPFFGRPAMTAPALARFALHFDCTVLPAQVERLGGARFRLTVHPPLALPQTGDRDADVTTLMTKVNQMLETWIRARPEQWLWLHRRWPD